MNSRIEFKQIANIWTIGASIPGIALVISVLHVLGFSQGYTSNRLSLSGITTGFTTAFGGLLSAFIWVVILLLLAGAAITNRTLYERGYKNWATAEVPIAIIIAFGLAWWRLQVEGGMGDIPYLVMMTVITTAGVWASIWTGVKISNRLRNRSARATTRQAVPTTSPVSPQASASAGSTNPTSQPTPNSPTTHR